LFNQRCFVAESHVRTSRQQHKTSNTVLFNIQQSKLIDMLLPYACIRM